MGYSHSFNMHKNVKGLSEVCVSRIKEVIENFKDIFKPGENDELIVEPDNIVINGYKDHGYETFYHDFRREFVQEHYTDKDFSYNFFKTNHADYDLPSCIILLIIKAELKELFNLKSDGFWVTEREYKLFKCRKKLELEEVWMKALSYVSEHYDLEFNFTAIANNGYYHFEISVATNTIEAGKEYSVSDNSLGEFRVLIESKSNDYKGCYLSSVIVENDTLRELGITKGMPVLVKKEIIITN